MVCSECGKRPATMHYVQTVNGVTTEKHLCSECAAKHQELNSLNLFSAGDFFKSFFDFGEQMPAVMGGPLRPSRRCAEKLMRQGFSGIFGSDAHSAADYKQFGRIAKRLSRG